MAEGKRQRTVAHGATELDLVDVQGLRPKLLLLGISKSAVVQGFSFHRNVHRFQLKFDVRTHKVAGLEGSLEGKNELEETKRKGRGRSFVRIINFASNNSKMDGKRVFISFGKAGQERVERRGKDGRNYLGTLFATVFLGWQRH